MNLSVTKYIYSAFSKMVIKLFPLLEKLNKNNIDFRLIESSLDHTYIGQQVKLYRPYHINDSIIQNYTYISHNSYISRTEIGLFCSIGPNLVCGYGIHPVGGITTHPMFYSTQKQNGLTLSKTDKIEERKKIVIGNDVLIGANVTILDGVSIGDGAIIGAGAVVSKNIPPYAVAVGCPIQIIKYRHAPEIIEKLLKIRWWNWEIEKLAEVEKYFDDVKEFLNRNP